MPKSEGDKKFPVIDKQEFGFFAIKNLFIDEFAKYVGWRGTIVFNSLSRHSNKARESWPSLELIAKQHGISRDTVMEGLADLVAARIIVKKQLRSDRGPWMRNCYQILGSESWVKKTRREHKKKVGHSHPIKKVKKVGHSHPIKKVKKVGDSVEKSRSQPPKIVAPVDYNNTHEQYPRRLINSLGEFELFWNAYPRRRSKGHAEKSWRKINPSGQMVEQILKGLEKAKSSRDWKKENGKFIPYPATWLNARGWEDEYSDSTANGARNYDDTPASLRA